MSYLYGYVILFFNIKKIFQNLLHQPYPKTKSRRKINFKPFVIHRNVLGFSKEIEQIGYLYSHATVCQQWTTYDRAEKFLLPGDIVAGDAGINKTATLPVF